MNSQCETMEGGGGEERIEGRKRNIRRGSGTLAAEILVDVMLDQLVGRRGSKPSVNAKASKKRLQLSLSFQYPNGLLCLHAR